MDASCSRRSHRPTSSPGLGDLPESCVAAIISHLDPADICRLATLNRAFRAASCVDFVWEPKLLDNYGVLVEELLGGSSENMGKRNIFTGLCHCQPKTFHDGTKIVWLDKTTLRICLEISVKTLAITGIDDPRYWNYIPTSESRFRTVAYLQQTWWFQVEGEVDFPFPPGAYSFFARLLLGRPAERFGCRACSYKHVHGWDKRPVEFKLRFPHGKSASAGWFLAEPGKWSNYHVGDFVVRRTWTNFKIKFSMKQIDCRHTKGGLCADSLLVYPNEFKERTAHKYFS